MNVPQTAVNTGNTKSLPCLIATFSVALLLTACGGSNGSDEQSTANTDQSDDVTASSESSGSGLNDLRRSSGSANGSATTATNGSGSAEGTSGQSTQPAPASQAVQTAARSNFYSVQMPTSPDSYLHMFGQRQCALAPLSSYSAVYSVSTVAQMKSAYATAIPGSAIVWANGTYSNLGADGFSGPGGQHGALVTIRPQTLGGVTFTGSFTQTFQAAHTEFVGFSFNGANTDGSWLVNMGGNFSKIRCNTVRNLTGNHGFAMYGHDGEASDNLFDGWTRLAFYQPSNTSDLTGRYTPRLRNHYHHNTFRNSTGEGTPFMLGYAYYMHNGPGSPEDESGAVLEWNLFDGPQADPETIAVKTGANIIRFNYFRNGKTGNHLSIRLGHNNIAYGNLFKINNPGFVTRTSGHNYRFLYNTVYVDNPADNVTMVFLHGQQDTWPAPYYAGHAGEYRNNVLIGVNTFAKMRQTYIANGQLPLPDSNRIFDNLWLDSAAPGYIDDSGLASESWFLSRNSVDNAAILNPVGGGRYTSASPIDVNMSEIIVVPNSIHGPVTINPSTIPWLNDTTFQ